MRIEVWSDIVCPWCGIGMHRLEEALARFPHAAEVEVVHRSFQLDPSFPAGETMPVKDMLEKKKGLPRAQVDKMTARVQTIAEAEGLAPYVVGDNVFGNTSLAHELGLWATEQGKPEAWKRLYATYWSKRSVFDVDALVAVARELGLDETAAREVLTTRRYRERVVADAREASQLGASGVPFFVFDRRFAVAGAQPLEAFEATLLAAWKDRRPEVMAGEGAVCGPAGCDPT